MKKKAAIAGIIVVVVIIAVIIGMRFFTGRSMGIDFFSRNGSSNGANSVNRVSELAEGAEVLGEKALSIRGSDVSDSESEVKEWASGF